MFYEKIDNDLQPQVQGFWVQRSRLFWNPRNSEPLNREPLNLQLQLFPAFVTIHRISQIVIAAGWTGFALRFVFD
jgi:hypothetical protein